MRAIIFKNRGQNVRSFYFLLLITADKPTLQACSCLAGQAADIVTICVEHVNLRLSVAHARERDLPVSGRQFYEQNPSRREESLKVTSKQKTNVCQKS